MNRRPEVWVADDDRSIRWVLEKALTQAAIDTRLFESGESLLAALEQAAEESAPDAIISDIRMPGIDGLGLLSRLREAQPELPVIITTAHSDLGSAVESYQGGAFEYLPKPFDIEEAVAVVRRALAQAGERSPAAPASAVGKPAEIIGEAPAMQEVFRAIGRLSQSNITVLINGESGTGKELVARALHRHSPRSGGAFIALNMAAIPQELMESELFGHEKGAFTGANSQRRGRFEQADGGTLFLDEIGDMPPATQTRLLRVLENGEFYRVGGHTPVRADVRIIAATHRNLEQLVAEHHFREDLYHRLNVIRIHIPKLAERREDIPQLMRHFFAEAAEELGIEPKHLPPETEAFLCQLDWPGNVRQLENACRWISVMASGREVHLEDLPPEFTQPSPQIPVSQPPLQPSGDAPGPWQTLLQSWARNELSQGRRKLLETAAPEFEKAMIEVALQHSRGRKRQASLLLGWGRNTLARKMKELGMEP